MRPPTKYKELLHFLEFRGSRKATFRELVGKHTLSGDRLTKDGDQEHYMKEFCFPRQTLDRLLKKGLKEGSIEKTEPREKGKKGRPAYQYGLSPEFSWTLPAMRFKDAYFFGVEKKCKHGKTFIQPDPHFQQMKDALYLKNPVFAEAVKKDRNKRKRVF